MDFTTDKLRSLVRKWQTLIEAHCDVQTTDGYRMRLFCIAFTKKRQNQIKKTCYAQSSQIRMVCGASGLPAAHTPALPHARTPCLTVCVPNTPAGPFLVRGVGGG
jgi:hypothetical protein